MKPAFKLPRRAAYLVILALILAAGVAGGFGFFHSTSDAIGSSGRSDLTLRDIPFNGRRAYEHLVAVCELGPRPSGSPGMRAQQKMLARHFTSLGGEVRWQRFKVRHPETGEDVQMANLIVHWHPERQKRVMLCAHYDTRPFPDQDRQNPRGVFVGANDGASGVALLCEMARHMPELKSSYGVDFVLFDGEEFIFNERRDRDDYYFVGSTYFARDYTANPPAYQYHAAVLVDMVADAHLDLYYEKNSYRWRPARPVLEDIWRIAAELGVRDFIPRVRYELRDDHLPLQQEARIAALDIIDFDYPRPGSYQKYWHTTEDTPDKCSALSLAKVGWVLSEWLRRIR